MGNTRKRTPYRSRLMTFLVCCLAISCRHPVKKTALISANKILREAYLTEALPVESLAIS